MTFQPPPLLPQPNAIDLATRGAWIGMNCDRVTQAAAVSFKLDQIRQNPSDFVGNQALLAQAKLDASRIGYGPGASLTSQIGNVEQTWLSGGYAKPWDQLVGSLSAAAAKPVAGILATGQRDQWNQFTSLSASVPGAAPPVDWDKLMGGFTASHPAPVPTSTPSLDQLLAGQTDANAFQSILDLPLPGSGQQGAPSFDLYQPSQGAIQTLPMTVFGGGAGRTDPVQRAIAVARRQIGKPYVWGGDNPKQDGGLDCSGLIQYSFGQAGVKLGRTTWQQVADGRHVPTNGMRPGDALYFDVNGGPRDANHTGLYIGNGQMIVAPHTGAQIQIQTVNDYWKSRIVDVRRFAN